MPIYKPCLVLLLLCQSLLAQAKPTHFSEAISVFRKAGVQKIFFGEKHKDPANFPIIANLIMGAAAETKNITQVWLESYYGTDDRTRQSYAMFWPDFNQAKPALRTELMSSSGVWNRLYDAQPQAYESMKAAFNRQTPEFRQIMINAPIKIVDAEFAGAPPSRALGRFLAAREFGIMKTGLGHAQASWIDTNLHSFLGIESNIQKLYWHPPMPLDEQRDMMDGFSRALANGPALLVVRSSDWLQNMNANIKLTGQAILPWTIQRLFLPQGMGLLAFDFKEFEATMIGPCSLLPIMKNIQKKAPKGTVRLEFNASYLCPNSAPPARDEL